MDLGGVIPSFGGVAWDIGAFIVAISIIVAIHEYGHYIVGRWSGIKADVFSIGFGPVLAARTDKHGTQWQLAAIPFGGFVKFRGDANAASVGSEAAPDLTPEERRATMHGAPLWARAATVFAGPLFNFILSVLLFAGLAIWSGVPATPLQVSELNAYPQDHAIEVGDEILAIGGTEINEATDFGVAADGLSPAAFVDYRIQRDGRAIDIEGPFPIPAIVGGFGVDSAAEAAGLQVGDLIVAVDGVDIYAFDQLPDIVAAAEGEDLTFTVFREGETLELVIAPLRQETQDSDGNFEVRWLIGIFGGYAFDFADVTPGLGTALSAGVDRTVFIVTSTFKGLYAMSVGRISTCNISGPIGIARVAGDAAQTGLIALISLIAVVSTAVGLLNLFPIPVLDGGHLVFHAYEAVTGRPPSDKALNALMMVGLGLMATLMVFAVSNDLFCP